MKNKKKWTNPQKAAVVVGVSNNMALKHMNSY